MESTLAKGPIVAARSGIAMEANHQSIVITYQPLNETTSIGYFYLLVRHHAVLSYACGDAAKEHGGSSPVDSVAVKWLLVP